MYERAESPTLLYYTTGRPLGQAVLHKKVEQILAFFVKGDLTQGEGCAIMVGAKQIE